MFFSLRKHSQGVVAGFTLQTNQSTGLNQEVQKSELPEHKNNAKCEQNHPLNATLPAPELCAEGLTASLEARLLKDKHYTTL